MKLLGSEAAQDFHFARFDLACCFTPIRSWRRRSIAPRSPRGSCAPTPTGTASRIRARAAQHRCLEAAAGSDWGRTIFRSADRHAASDVASACAESEADTMPPASIGRSWPSRFEFLPVRARLDLDGWAEQDIFRLVKCKTAQSGLRAAHHHRRKAAFAAMAIAMNRHASFPASY